MLTDAPLFTFQCAAQGLFRDHPCGQSIQKKSDFEPATSCRLQNARFMRFFGVFTQK